MVGSICSSYLGVQLAVLRDAIADNQPCFSYMGMRASTDNLPQTSMGYDSLTLLVEQAMFTETESLNDKTLIVLERLILILFNIFSFQKLFLLQKP